MERSLAGMLFLVAAVAFSVSAGGWWMQRVVFTPDGTRESAEAILEAADIRLELNTVITGATAGPLGMSTSDLSMALERDVLSTSAGAVVMAPLMHEAHERIIGLRDDEPIRVTGRDLIPIVRDERAADVESLTLPIQPIGVLKNTRSVLGWMIPVTAAIGALTLLLGLATRPDRRDVLRGLGEFGLALACSMLVFGYLIPTQFLTGIDNRTWTHAIPRLATQSLPVVLGAAAIFAGGGAALLLASVSGGKRRQWSTPLSVARYRGGNNPGWS